MQGFFFSGNNFCGNGFFGGQTSFSGLFHYGIHTHIYILHAINNGLNRTELSLIRSVIIGMRRGRKGSPLLKMSCEF